MGVMLLTAATGLARRQTTVSIRSVKLEYLGLFSVTDLVTMEQCVLKRALQDRARVRALEMVTPFASLHPVSKIQRETSFNRFLASGVGLAGHAISALGLRAEPRAVEPSLSLSLSRKKDGAISWSVTLGNA